MRSSAKKVSESEAASVTESRLAFYRSMEDVVRQLRLSADSITIFFGSSGGQFPATLPSEEGGSAETFSDAPNEYDSNAKMLRQRHALPGSTDYTHARKDVSANNGSRCFYGKPTSNAAPMNTTVPHHIKIYGLHLTDSSEAKSFSQADLKDSVAANAQSSKSKSATKQSSKPSSAPKYIFYILILACIVYAIHRLRRI